MNYTIFPFHIGDWRLMIRPLAVVGCWLLPLPPVEWITSLGFKNIKSLFGADITPVSNFITTCGTSVVVKLMEVEISERAERMAQMERNK